MSVEWIAPDTVSIAVLFPDGTHVIPSEVTVGLRGHVLCPDGSKLPVNVMQPTNGKKICSFFQIKCV